MRRPLFVAALLLAAAVPAAAQQLYLAPTVGLYAPLTNLADLTSGEEIRQEVGLAIGGRVGVAFGGRFALEATGSYVPSSLRRTLSGEGITPASEDANLFYGSSRATLYLIPATSPLWLSVSGGVSVVDRSGPAYATATDTRDIGGIAGVAAGVRLGGIGIFASTESYIYRTGAFGTANADRTQNDLHVNLGFGVPLGGRR